LTGRVDGPSTRVVETGLNLQYLLELVYTSAARSVTRLATLRL